MTSLHRTEGGWIDKDLHRPEEVRSGIEATEEMRPVIEANEGGQLFASSVILLSFAEIAEINTRENNYVQSP